MVKMRIQSIWLFLLSFITFKPGPEKHRALPNSHSALVADKGNRPRETYTWGSWVSPLAHHPEGPGGLPGQPCGKGSVGRQHTARHEILLSCGREKSWNDQWPLLLSLAECGKVTAALVWFLREKPRYITPGCRGAGGAPGSPSVTMVTGWGTRWPVAWDWRWWGGHQVCVSTNRNRVSSGGPWPPSLHLPGSSNNYFRPWPQARLDWFQP